MVLRAKRALGSSAVCALASYLLLVSGCAAPPAAVERSATAATQESTETLSPEDWVRQGLAEPGSAGELVASATAPASDLRGVVYGGGQEEQPDELEELDLDSLLGDELTEEAPEEATEGAEAPPAPDMAPDADKETEPTLPELDLSAEPAPAAPRSREIRTADDALERTRLYEDAARAESRELTQRGKTLKLGGEYLQAQGLLEKAVMLWPQNAEAKLLLEEIGLLLGDKREELPQLARSFFEQQTMEQAAARAEVQHRIYLGRRYLDEEEYDQAIDEFSRALDMVTHWPFDLQLEQEKKDAEAGLTSAKAGKELKDAKLERERLKMIRDQRDRERMENLDILRNRIRELRRRAISAEENEEYARAAEYHKQILELDPTDKEAQLAYWELKERHHMKRMANLMRTTLENYRVAIIGVEESAVMYQQIFRYPDKEEWARISPKVTSIEEEVERAVSEAEKEIRRKLDAPISFGPVEDEPLKDVLEQLQGLSQINFFLKSPDVGENTITVDQFNNLPLKNILRFILKQVGEEYAYVIKEQAVQIGEGEALDEPKYLKMYEISDLIQDRPDFPAPDLALDELQGRQQGAGGGVAALDFGEDDTTPTTGIQKDKLLELIHKELTGEEGMEAEGIKIYGGKLTAYTTLQNHMKLAKILDRFRKSMGMMVTVESRFLDIQDNFLEEIGVNWGGQNSNLPNTIPDIDGSGTALSPGYEFIDARGDFNLRSAAVGAFSNPLGSQVNPFNLSASGGAAYQLNVLDAERFQLEAILTARAKEQKIRKLNSPRVTAFNTQTAHTLVVEQAAYIQDLEVNQTGVIPVINPVIGVLNTGSILEVRPTISHDRKYVILEIQPTLAEEIGRDIAILNLAGNFTVVPVQLPILSVTKIKTTVTVPDGGTILLGGLKREIKADASIGIPVLRQIPILNMAFGRWGTSTLRSNLYVMINAQITIIHEEEEQLGLAVR